MRSRRADHGIRPAYGARSRRHLIQRLGQAAIVGCGCLARQFDSASKAAVTAWRVSLLIVMFLKSDEFIMRLLRAHAIVGSD